MHDNQEQKQLFERISIQNKGILFKIARIYCPQEDDRQDLIQEMLIRIWLSLPRYNPQFTLSTWIYRVCLNTAISYYRKNSRRIIKTQVLDRQILEINEFIPDGTLIEQIDRLFQLINQLKEIDKAVIFLYLEEKSHREIAEILGLSETNIGTKIMRIKKQLKSLFYEQ